MLHGIKRVGSETEVEEFGRPGAVPLKETLGYQHPFFVFVSQVP